MQRFPGYGGAEEYVHNLAKKFAEKGHDCIIFSSDLDSRRVEMERHIRLERFPVAIRFGEYAIWRGLIRRLLSLKVDLIHTHTYGYYHSDAAVLIGHHRRLPIVLTSHGFHNFELYTLIRKGLLQKQSILRKLRYTLRLPYDYTVGRREIRSANALVALSRRDSSIFEWLGACPDRIKLIPPGVAEDFFAPPDIEASKAIKKWVDENQVILTVGELSWTKAKDVVVNAFGIISRKYPHAKLILVGRDAGEESRLRRLCADLGVSNRTIFAGYVSPWQLRALYTSAEVLVHTSYSEGVSLSVLQAMSTSLPVVTTPAGGNGIVVNEGNCGIVTPFEDPQAVADACDSILGGDRVRMNYGRNGGQYARSHFKWSMVAKEHESLYRSLVS